ncbi:MAG: hypothetical protein IJ642_00210 [Oscillospiraceae bacterium]|nr:hypothetical protein [Oscillospiraceae bacterium]
MNHQMSAEELKKYFDIQPIENKEQILCYLKSVPWVAFTSQPAIDKITGDQILDANNARSDGVWHWYEDEIYYFEKYNLRLKSEFIEYMKKGVFES